MLWLPCQQGTYNLFEEQVQTYETDMKTSVYREYNKLIMGM